MSRVVLLLAITAAAVALTSGCAHYPSPEPVAKRAAPGGTKVVTVEKPATVVVKTRTCTRTVERENICAVVKSCREITTCAEAQYRLATCGHQRLDFNRNGIPCENRCGMTQWDMAEKIAKEGGPYSPPMHPVGEPVCTTDA
jgi:hypothetical protein